MDTHAFGQICAILTALTWAAALVLFKQSGQQVSPLALNLFKNTVGCLLLAASVLLLTLTGHEDLADLWDHPWQDFALLAASGIIGIAVADTIFFHALNRIGVGLVVIADCSYTPFSVLFAWLLLGERLSAIHYVGAVLIVAAVLTAARTKLPRGRSPADVAVGVALAVFAMGLMAFAIVVVKPVLEEMSVFSGALIRLVGGQVLLSLLALRGSRWRQCWQVFRPSAVWRVALPGAVLGTYVSMLFWVAGFKYTHASVAAALNQTNVIFASILAAVFLSEAFGRRKLAALALATIGALLITVGPAIAWVLVCRVREVFGLWFV